MDRECSSENLKSHSNAHNISANEPEFGESPANDQAEANIPTFDYLSGYKMNILFETETEIFFFFLQWGWGASWAFRPQRVRYMLSQHTLFTLWRVGDKCEKHCFYSRERGHLMLLSLCVRQMDW